jgi:hypothetical protein
MSSSQVPGSKFIFVDSPLPVLLVSGKLLCKNVYHTVLCDISCSACYLVYQYVTCECQCDDVKRSNFVVFFPLQVL